MVTGNFLASFRKHLNRSQRQKNLRNLLTLAPLSANCYDRQLPIQNSMLMTTRWHFDRTVTQREILERNRHHKHLFVIWSTLKTDGFFDTFSGAWDSFNLKKKNSCSENISVPVSLPLKIKAKKESE